MVAPTALRNAARNSRRAPLGPSGVHVSIADLANRSALMECRVTTALAVSTLLLAGCASQPQTPEEFRKAVPSAFMGKTETFEVDRSFRDVAETFQRRGARGPHRRGQKNEPTPAARAARARPLHPPPHGWQ